MLSFSLNVWKAVKIAEWKTCIKAGTAKRACAWHKCDFSAIRKSSGSSRHSYTQLTNYNYKLEKQKFLLPLRYVYNLIHKENEMLSLKRDSSIFFSPKSDKTNYSISSFCVWQIIKGPSLHKIKKWRANLLTLYHIRKGKRENVLIK